jgi:hypothetical protein
MQDQRFSGSGAAQAVIGRTIVHDDQFGLGHIAALLSGAPQCVEASVKIEAAVANRDDEGEFHE